MKHILLIAIISLSITSCSKEFSQEGRQFPQNHVIDDEPGGLNFFLHTNGAEISVNIYYGNTQVPVNERSQYYEYEVSATDLQDNISYTVELQYHSVPAPGTFDVMVDGFTSSPGMKNFWINGIPISVSDAGTKKDFLTMTKSGNKYTFTEY